MKFALKEAISDLERVAQQRLAEIVSTIERLTSQPPEEPLGLRADLDALKAASRLLGNGSAKGNRTPI
ncbi:MAG: hypothetical protein JO182_05590 [Acidobacteriaceae bacterium]|nr:hypothetical protein [Acidobacteriaceae bacterium]MBV9937605.1 hypothetical protein [Acidobacteriaceae bacterium]